LPQTRSRTLTACALLASACAIGCAPRVVLVGDSAPARIGPGAKARLYTLQADGTWQLSGQAVPLPEGYYLVSPRWVEEAP